VYRGTVKDWNSDYARLLADIPVPTVDQTSRYAIHVARSHSWYKHLPLLPPGGTFVCYLDPGAGRTRIQTPEGREVLIPRSESDDSTLHYSLLPTRKHLDLFGHWNYQASHRPGIFVMSNAGISHIDAGEVAILDPAGEWVKVPPDETRIGTCHLTAFVHERFNPFALRADRLTRDLENFKAFASPKQRSQIIDRYRPLHDHLERLKQAEEGGTDKDWSDTKEIFGLLKQFHAEERPRQMQVLLQTLKRIRRRHLDGQRFASTF